MMIVAVLKTKINVTVIRGVIDDSHFSAFQTEANYPVESPPSLGPALRLVLTFMFFTSSRVAQFIEFMS